MKRVVVIGAGVAGLTAAYRLGAAGHEVTVLETQPRVGGRALTLRSLVSDGLIAHAGPARFPSDCRRVLAFARELGLPLAPFYPRSGRFVAHRGGVRIADHRPTADELWGYIDTAERAGRPSRGVSTRLTDGAREMMRALRRGPTLAALRFVDGTDALTDALARAMPAELRLGATVQGITQQTGGIRIAYTSEGVSMPAVADHVVCAIPLSRLSTLEWSPPLPPAMRDLATAVPFTPAIRIFVEMRRPFWRDDGYNGFAITDTIGEVWDSEFDRPHERAMLTCYARDALAERLTALDERGRVDAAVTALDAVFPGARAHFVHGASFAWREQPWIGGGWPAVPPALETRMRIFRDGHGRVGFAGDYATSPEWLHTVEGAIESADHAARRAARA